MFETFKGMSCLRYIILRLFAGHAIGRDAFLHHNIIPPVAKLFDDKQDVVRKNANLAIEMVSETPSGMCA